MHTPRSLILCVLAVASLVLAPAQAAGAADGQVWSYAHVQIAPGTYFTWGTDTSGGHLRHVAILEIHPGTTATIDTAMPKSSMPGGAGISTMVPNEANSVAGVNGDFGSNRPLHAFMMDGEMWQSGLDPGPAFGVRRDETGAYVGRPHLNVSVKTATSTIGVDRVNSSAGLSAATAKTEVAMFSPRGGSADKPPVKVCAVRLKNPTALKWAARKKSVQRTYTVDAQKCAAKGASSTPLPVQANTLVLTSMMGAGTKQSQIKAFKSLVGQQVTVRWSMGGFPNVLDAIGGSPQLLVDGAINTADLSNAKCGGAGTGHGGTVGCNNPRTAIGVNHACVKGRGDCTIWIVVVDGRQSGWSGGMCLLDNVTNLAQCKNGTVGLAHFMKNLGAYDAINLDGGGSTGMWIKKSALTSGNVATTGGSSGKHPNVCQTVSGAQNGSIGCFVNRPTTDGTHIAERAAQNAVIVLNGPDTNEPL
jgi:Phosphodiester glycosidase